MITNGKFKVNQLQFKNVTIEESDDASLKVSNIDTQESVLIGTSQNIDYRQVFNPSIFGVTINPDSYYVVNNDTVTLFVECTIDNSYFNKFIMMQLPILAKSVANGHVHIQDPNDSEISTNMGSVYIDDSKFFLVIKSNLIDPTIMSTLQVTFNISYIRRVI